MGDDGFDLAARLPGRHDRRDPFQCGGRGPLAAGVGRGAGVCGGRRPGAAL